MSAELLFPHQDLPLELKAYILSFADTDTLARACSVSLACLQMAAPLLYRDITFVGPEGLEKFLTLRADVQVPELAPYLDLSLVQSITYIDDGLRTFDPPIHPNSNDLSHLTLQDRAALFVPHRLLPPNSPGGPSFPPLPVQSIRLEVGPWTPFRLWDFFDPVSVHVQGGLEHENDETEMYIFADLPFTRWTRLRTITLVDVVSENPLFYAPFTKEWTCGPVVLRMELSLGEKDREWVCWIAEDARGPRGAKGAGEFLGEVVIEVRTDVMKAFFDRELADSPLLGRTTVLVKPAEVSSFLLNRAHRLTS